MSAPGPPRMASYALRLVPAAWEFGAVLFGRRDEAVRALEMLPHLAALYDLVWPLRYHDDLCEPQEDVFV